MPGREIHWPGSGGPPLDFPPCGFDNNNPACKKSEYHKGVHGAAQRGPGPISPMYPPIVELQKIRAPSRADEGYVPVG